MPKLFLSPFVWLRRFRHRCGYGVHSPFAFEFITGVIYERWPYYAYSELDALLPWWVRGLGLRPRKRLRLLFRLANWREPARMLLVDPSPEAYAYIRRAVQKAELCSNPDGVADFIYVSHPSEEALRCADSRSILVVDNLRQHLDWWLRVKQDPRTAITFDLYDMGIVLFDRQYNRIDYTVSF